MGKAGEDVGDVCAIEDGFECRQEEDEDGGMPRDVNEAGSVECNEVGIDGCSRLEEQ